MPKSRLTKTVADQAEPLAKLYTINDTVIPGFMLKVTPTGTKTFIYQYRLLGGRKNTTRTLTIGRFGPVTVDQARDRARGHQLAVHSGRVITHPLGTPRFDRSGRVLGAFRRG